MHNPRSMKMMGLMSHALTLIAQSNMVGIEPMEHPVHPRDPWDDVEPYTPKQRTPTPLERAEKRANLERAQDASLKIDFAKYIKADEKRERKAQKRMREENAKNSNI